MFNQQPSSCIWWLSDIDVMAMQQVIGMSDHYTPPSATRMNGGFGDQQGRLNAAQRMLSASCMRIAVGYGMQVELRQVLFQFHQMSAQSIGRLFDPDMRVGEQKVASRLASADTDPEFTWLYMHLRERCNGIVLPASAIPDLLKLRVGILTDCDQLRPINEGTHYQPDQRLTIIHGAGN